MKKLIIKPKHESPFDRQKMISWWDQERLTQAKIMIVGAGAIGNETIKNLALMGIGYLFIVDFDHIEKSNLSRTVLFKTGDIGQKKAEIAAERAKELALVENFRVDWYHGDLVHEIGSVIYQQFDVVLGCLDNIEARIVVNKHCMSMKIPWIDAGIRELGVRVNPYLPNKGVCFECGLTDEELSSANQRFSCFNFKKEDEQKGKVPTTQIAASIAAAWQTQEAIKLICDQPMIDKKYIYYQGNYHDFDLIGNVSDPGCFTHNIDDTDFIPLGLSNQVTVSELLDTLQRQVQEELELTLEGEGWSFIKSVTCAKCGNEVAIQKPNYRIKTSGFQCNHCIAQGLTEPRLGTQFRNIEYLSSCGLENEEYLSFTLEQIGFPQGALVTVKSQNRNWRAGLKQETLTSLLLEGHE